MKLQHTLVYKSFFLPRRANIMKLQWQLAVFFRDIFSPRMHSFMTYIVARMTMKRVRNFPEINLAKLSYKVG